MRDFEYDDKKSTLNLKKYGIYFVAVLDLLIVTDLF